jgi:hypothetical protein
MTRRSSQYLKAAALILFPVSQLGASLNAKAPRIFTCAGTASFSVVLSPRWPQVHLAHRLISMALKPSSIGMRFASSEGTLIIDDDFATLLLTNDPQYQSCHSDIARAKSLTDRPPPKIG